VGGGVGGHFLGLGKWLGGGGLCGEVRCCWGVR